MKKIKNFKIKTYSSKTGKLIPIYFNKKFPMKVKRVFILYGKKIKSGEIMLTKNAHSFLFLYWVNLS